MYELHVPGHNCICVERLDKTERGRSRSIWCSILNGLAVCISLLECLGRVGVTRDKDDGIDTRLHGNVFFLVSGVHDASTNSY